METRLGGEPAVSWRDGCGEKSRSPWRKCRAVGNRTNCRARKSTGFCVGRAALPQDDYDFAVSIRLTRVPASPCSNRPVRRKLCFPIHLKDCFKAGGFPKLNLP